MTSINRCSCVLGTRDKCTQGRQENNGIKKLIEIRNFDSNCLNLQFPGKKGQIANLQKKKQGSQSMPAVVVPSDVAAIWLPAIPNHRLGREGHTVVLYK
jgi:hypothetical protein